MNTPGREAVMTLLREELALAKQCHEITIKQKQNLDAEDAEALKALLTQRREVLEKLGASRSAVAEALRGGELDRNEQKIEDETFGLLRQVQRLDEESVNAIKSLMEKYSAEGKNLDLSRKGIGLYNQKDAILSSSFFDRKS